MADQDDGNAAATEKLARKLANAAVKNMRTYDQAEKAAPFNLAPALGEDNSNFPYPYNTD